MPTFEVETGRHTAPDDRHVEERLDLLKALGLYEDRPVVELDALATRFARDFSGRTGPDPDAFFGFVNIMKRDHQYFAGLHLLADPGAGQRAAQTTAIPPEARTMSRSEGWCVQVLDRTSALPLPHIKAMPRWSGNAAVAKLGAETYLGAPLIIPGRKFAFGTVAIVGKKKTLWTRDDVDHMKGYAGLALEIISMLPGNTVNWLPVDSSEAPAAERAWS